MSYCTNEFNDKVVELLKSGGVGLLPTDTIYGLSALALDRKAVEKIHELKQRDDGKPMVVLIADIRQLEDLKLPSANIELLEKYWPGPLSVEFDATNSPGWLHRGKHYFAVRLPGDDQLRDLIAKTGPLVSTSANIQGSEPAKNVQEAKKYFGDNLNFYVDVGNLSGKSSTLVKVEDNKFIILRQGAYKIKVT